MPLVSNAALLAGYLPLAMVVISATMRTSHSLITPSGGGASGQVNDTRGYPVMGALWRLQRCRDLGVPAHT